MRRETPDSVTLTLRANRAWEGFRAGQFIQVAVEIDGVRRTRCYSPASVAGTGRELELTVKSHPEGLVSNFLIEQRPPGDGARRSSRPAATSSFPTSGPSASF